MTAANPHLWVLTWWVSREGWVVALAGIPMEAEFEMEGHEMGLQRSVPYWFVRMMLAVAVAVAFHSIQRVEEVLEVVDAQQAQRRVEVGEVYKSRQRFWGHPDQLICTHSPRNKPYLACCCGGGGGCAWDWGG